ncbi:hypothetical protein KCU87_g396, partial [Aureobasidium melanogenum]
MKLRAASTKHTVQRGQRHREEVLVGVAELKTTTVWAREQLPVYLYVCHCRGQPFGASENNSRGQNAARRVEVAVDEGQMDESTSERTCFFRRNGMRKQSDHSLAFVSRLFNYERVPRTLLCKHMGQLRSKPLTGLWSIETFLAPIRGIALFVTPAPVLDDAAVDVDVEVDLVMDVILDVADRVGVVMADVLVMPDTLAGPMLTVGSSVLDVVAGLILTLLWFINSVTPSLGPEQDLAAPWADAVRRGIVRLTRSFNHDLAQSNQSNASPRSIGADQSADSCRCPRRAQPSQRMCCCPYSVPDEQPSGRSRRLTRTRNHRVKGVYGECLPRWSRRLGHRYPVTKSAVCLWGYLTATHHAAVVCLRQEVVVCARLCHHGLHDNIVEACVTAPASHQYKGQGNVPIDSFGVSVLLFWAARDGRSFIGASRCEYELDNMQELNASRFFDSKCKIAKSCVVSWSNWIQRHAFGFMQLRQPSLFVLARGRNEGMTPCYVAGSTWRKVILYGWMKEQHFCCGFGDVRCAVERLNLERQTLPTAITFIASLLSELCERQWREQVNMSLFLGSILNVLYAVLRLSQPRRRSDLEL